MPASIAKLLTGFYNGNHVRAPRARRHRPKRRPDRLDREPAEAGLCSVPGLAFCRLDRAAGATLRQPAARSDRGADLRPGMATRLRQAATAAVVAGRDHAPHFRRRRRLLRAGATGRDRRTRGGLGDGAAACRRDRRAGCGADHRRHALSPVHRGEVQSRRHSTAVLGLGRLRLSCRAQTRPHRTLAAARLLLRRHAMGQIFCRRAGGALRAVSAGRSRRAPRAGNARAVACADRRARGCGAARHLAIPDRFPAAGLCRASRIGGARLVRPRFASLGVCRQPDFFPVAVVLHRLGAVLAAAKSNSHRRRENIRPTPSTAAS